MSLISYKISRNSLIHLHKFPQKQSEKITTFTLLLREPSVNRNCHRQDTLHCIQHTLKSRGELQSNDFQIQQENSQ